MLRLRDSDSGRPLLDERLLPNIGGPRPAHLERQLFTVPTAGNFFPSVPQLLINSDHYELVS